MDYMLWALYLLLMKCTERTQGVEGPPIRGLGIGLVQCNSTLPDFDTLDKKGLTITILFLKKIHSRGFTEVTFCYSAEDGIRK
jgi:hypothetical protein